MRLALFQPEIPQNTGTLLRLGACLGVAVDIIEPCSFLWHDQKLKRSGMDYMDLVNVTRHASWSHFQDYCNQHHHRMVLIDVQGETPFYDFSFTSQDVLVVGQESVGVPGNVFHSFTDRVHIPMRPGCRSLNVAVAASMVLTEALRQNHLFQGECLR